MCGLLIVNPNFFSRIFNSLKGILVKAFFTISVNIPFLWHRNPVILQRGCCGSPAGTCGGRSKVVLKELLSLQAHFARQNARSIGGGYNRVGIGTSSVSEKGVRGLWLTRLKGESQQEIIVHEGEVPCVNNI